MEMKDMIVIKNLPSNIVEEAWVVIKPEVRNKEKELIKRIKNSKTNTKAENGYVLKEAETVIYDYLKNINSYEDKKKYNDIIRKYNKLKKDKYYFIGNICELAYTKFYILNINTLTCEYIVQIYYQGRGVFLWKEYCQQKKE